MPDQTRPRRPGTILAHLGEEPLRYHGAASPPIFQTSTFVFPDPDAAAAAWADPRHHFVYTRGNNPTVQVAQEKIAALEQAEACRCFASGMAAISAAIMAHVRAGDHVVCVRHAYGPTQKFLSQYLTRFGVQTDFVGGEDPGEWAAATRPTTRLYYLESPTSLVFGLQDLRAVAALARERGIVTVIDNTWASPLYQQPLALGIDLAVHTATKYLGGHSDLVAGAVCGPRAMLDRIAATEEVLLGATLGPLDAWLLVRGLRTLELRMARHMQSALALAAWLEQQPQVVRVLHPGLPSHPQHALHLAQATGAGSLFAIELAGGARAAVQFTRHLRYFGLGVSWGGFESLAWAPAVTRRRDEQLRAAGLPPGLVRLHVGLEDPADLQADLAGALAAL